MINKEEEEEERGGEGKRDKMYQGNLEEGMRSCRLFGLFGNELLKREMLMKEEEEGEVRKGEASHLLKVSCFEEMLSCKLHVCVGLMNERERARGRGIDGEGGKGIAGGGGTGGGEGEPWIK